MKFQSILIAIATITVLAGCGGGGSDGVISSGTQSVTAPTTGGASNPAPQVTSLTFQFTRAQNLTLPLPSLSTRISFEFLDGSGNVLLEEERNFATVITFTDVSPDIKEVKLTARDASGYPIREIRKSVDIIANQDVVVNFEGAETTEIPNPTVRLLDNGYQETIVTDGNPISFDSKLFFLPVLLFENGEQIPVALELLSATVRNTSVARVYLTNQQVFFGFEGVGPGQTVGEVIIPFRNQNLVKKVQIAITEFKAQTPQLRMTPGSSTVARFDIIRPDGRVETDVANKAGAQAEFAVKPHLVGELTGVTLPTGGPAGTVEVDPNTPPGTLFTVEIRYQDPETGTTMVAVCSGGVVSPDIGTR